MGIHAAGDEDEGKCLMPTAVYVHLGPSRPRWLPSTVRRAVADGYNVAVVVDEPTWRERLPSSVKVVTVRRRAVPRGSFRDGFWCLSTDRFSAIAEAHPRIAGPIFHVESDVRLTPGIPLDRLQRSVRDVAFALLAVGRGSGATVLLRDPAASGALAESLERHMRDRAGSDMEGLWNYWASNQSTVSLLPGNEPDDDPRLERAIGRQWAKEHAALRCDLNGIFDCASFGQYLFGTDGRNSRYGLRVLGSTSEEHFAQPRALRFQAPLAWPLDFQDGTSLLSLHVHSKAPRVLQADSPHDLVRQPLGNVGRELDLWALRTNAVAAVKRRLYRVREAGC